MCGGRKRLTVIVLITFLIISIFSQNLWATANLPKCCDLGRSVVEENSTLVCRNSTNKRLHLTTTFIQETIDEKLCMDNFESDFFIFEKENGTFTPRVNISSKALRKCCSPGYFYNYHNKSCDVSDDEGTLNALLITVGLPQCRIINDYVFQSFNATKKMYKSYKENMKCLDQTTSGEYVLRVCESMSICETTRCLHKCCEDGKSFVNGSNCRDTFEKGFHLHHLSDNIENLTGKLILVF